MIKLVRIVFLKILYIIFFATIILRLFYWQVIQASQLQFFADKQHTEDITLSALRGDIRFSDGSILASTKPVFILFGLPKTITDTQKKQLSTILAKILAKDPQEEISLKANLINSFSRDLYWVNLKKDLDYSTKKRIEDLRLPGIGFDQANSRFYPEGSSSAHILGFLGSNASGQEAGYFGLEGFYDGELKGLSGVTKFEKDALGLPILIGKFTTAQPQNGKNLILNLDKVVQYSLEKHLKEGMEKYGAKSAQAIVMNPITGAILGMAAYPNYDPLTFYSFPSSYYRNPLVADSYEPGSTFKVLVMAAAINENLVKPDTKCDICSGSVQLGGFTIRTWDDKYFPDSTMTDVIIHSDNTGMVFISQKLGIEKMYSYIQNLGFGETTGIDLQDESSPDIRSKNDWREIDLATSSFGQGIAVTPVQMIRAVAAIANGGDLMEPHLVNKVKDENKTFDIKPKVVRKIFKKETASVIKEMMVKAVDEGEAKWAKPKGFKIAGKTGTAQIPVAGHYDPNKTIASFVGFAPADNPKFVMLVKYDQPSSSIFGAETAAPTFFDIAKDLFTYYKIAPEE